MNELQKDQRDLVQRLETQLQQGPTLNVDDLTSHHFARGIYMRELLIPAGHCCVGKIHRDEHLNVLLSGKIAVLTEHGVKLLEGPCILKSFPGIKRAGYAVTDTRWLTVHANPDDEHDMEKLETRYIAPDFAALESKPDEVALCLGVQ